MILHLLEEKPMTTGEITKALPSIKYQTIQKTLDRLQKRKKIKKEGQIWELVPSEQDEIPF
jgi:DNA-binding HxlR family transcriptional regulator